jgi:hypothetical protein
VDHFIDALLPSGSIAARQPISDFNGGIELETCAIVSPPHD